MVKFRGRTYIGEGITVKKMEEIRNREILAFAEHYHNPVSDLKGFNRLLKSEGIQPVTRKTLVKLLRY